MLGCEGLLGQHGTRPLSLQRVTYLALQNFIPSINLIFIGEFVNPYITYLVALLLCARHYSSPGILL